MLYSEKFKLKAEFIKSSREKQISSYGLYINKIDINDIDYYTDDDISDLEIHQKVEECDINSSQKEKLRKIIILNKQVFYKSSLKILNTN